jgi:hypothetical protein
MKHNVYCPLNKWHRFNAELYNKIVKLRKEREEQLKKSKK